ncbi:MAG: hypothetical protein H7101_07275 [Deinococcales bacterium]|nr:hypothetical protein [Chitinophagaceae bacterium]
MKYSFFFSIFAILTFSAFAQTPAQINAVKTQANIMVTAMKKQDYKTLVKMTYPKAVAVAGGEAKMLEGMNKGLGQMKTNGISFSNVSVGEPSAIITVGKQLQCTIPDKLEMKMMGGTIGTNSTLIGISDDKGKTWTFIDAVGKDLVTLRKVIPTLSNKLIIPKMQQPQFVADK